MQCDDYWLPESTYEILDTIFSVSTNHINTIRLYIPTMWDWLTPILFHHSALDFSWIISSSFFITEMTYACFGLLLFLPLGLYSSLVTLYHKISKAFAFCVSIFLLSGMWCFSCIMLNKLWFRISDIDTCTWVLFLKDDPQTLYAKWGYMKSHGFRFYLHE